MILSSSYEILKQMPVLNSIYGFGLEFRFLSHLCQLWLICD